MPFHGVMTGSIWRQQNQIWPKDPCGFVCWSPFYVAVSENLEILTHEVLHIIFANPGVSKIMDLLGMTDSAAVGETWLMY